MLRTFAGHRLGRGILRPAAMLVFCGLVSGGFSLLRAQDGRRAAAPKQEGAGRLVISPLTRGQATQKFDHLPWAFEPNEGQADARVKFLSRANDATVFLTQSSVVIAWPAPHSMNRVGARGAQPVLSLEFSGAARNAAISGQQELPGKTNYLLGNDPRKWRRNVPHYSSVAYRGLYPGIDARFYGGPRGLEYDLMAAPRSDVRAIAMQARGATTLRLDSRGNLEARVAGRDVLMRRPVVYQLDGARRIPVAGRYRLLGRDSFGFTVGPHRADLPLTIDPSISVTYTTFLGGTGAEEGNSVAVDSTGAVYVGGTTTIAPFTEPAPAVSPTTLGVTTGTSVLFVAKVDTTQSGANSLSYLTFLGGSADNEGGLVAADNSASPANLAILGWTTSTDFPTANPTTATPSGSINLTISKLNGAGNGFIYSEYYGGSGAEATQGTGVIVQNSTGGGIATDSAGDVFVTSDTTSTDLPQPSPANGFQPLFEGTGAAATGTNNDGFFAEFNSTGTLLYSTYFGIAAHVGSTSVAVDASGNAYVAGFTSQPSNSYFPPATANPFQATYHTGAADNAIVLEINPRALIPASSLVYASYLGGSGTDKAFGIGVDNAGPANAYVTGSTSSTDFVSNTGLSNGFQTALGSSATGNAFLAVISQDPTTCPAPALVCLTYASYLGGTKADSGQGVAVVLASPPGPSTDVLVAGKTTSADFPVFCPSQSLTGTEDAFIASFNPTASGPASLLVSTFFGGSATTEANAIATDSAGDAIIFGDTLSSDYPLGANPNPNNGFQPTCTSCAAAPPLSDAFLTKTSVSTAASGCIAFNPSVANLGTFPVGSTTVPPFNGTVTNAGNGTVSFTSLNITGANAPDFPLESPGGSQCTSSTVLTTSSPGNQCTITIGFTPTVAGQETAALQISDSGANTPQQSLDIIGIGTAPEVTISTSPPTNPPALTFPNQTVGTTSSPPQVVTVTNSGNADLHVSNVLIDSSVGYPSDFTLPSVSNCLSGPIAAGASCTIDVAFSPNTAGPLTGQVDIVDDANNATGAQQTIALSGTGIATTFIIGFSPSSLTFPSQNVGTTSPPMNITVTNSGTGTLNISSITPTGTNASEFLIDATTNCPINGSGVGPGASCIIAVDFAPTATGTANAAISIADNATNVPSPQTVAVTGTGAGAIATLSATTLTFGSISVGSTSSTQTVTLTNTGAGTNLVLSSLGITGANPTDFQLNAATTCATGGAGLAPSTSCSIVVDFAPTASGSRFADVSIADNAAGSPQTIALSGTGTQAVASLSQTAVAFGSVNVNTTSTAPAVTLTNTGNQNLNITSVKINPSVGTPGDFSFTGSNTCASIGSVAPLGTCTITISFTPAATGSVTGEVDIVDNASPSTQTISLSGTGTAPGVTLSPSTLSFGSENVGSATSPQTVTLTNSGSGSLTISNITFTGANPGDFGETNSCPISPAQLASGNACVISITFQPTATKARSAFLSVTDTAPGSPQTVGVSGTGTQPAVSLNPASGLSFPATVVGTSSGTRSLTVNNTGTGPLVISSITFTGPNAADFSASAPTCIGSGISIAAGGNCTVNVTFVPQPPDSPSTRTATLVLTDNASPTTQSDSVSGDATDFSLSAISGGVTTATVTAGETAIFPLQLNPVDGFTGTVTFGCTNPPPKGGCTVSPTSLQITGPNPVSFSVNVSTSAATAALPRLRGAPRPRGPWLPLAMWSLMAMALLLLIRARGRRRLKLIPACAFALSLALLSSCSSTSTNGNPGGGTPPGTYTVTVTGSIPSGAARPLQLTVTVN
jgi:hypothetical protein